MNALVALLALAFAAGGVPAGPAKPGPHAKPSEATPPAPPTAGPSMLPAPGPVPPGVTVDAVRALPPLFVGPPVAELVPSREERLAIQPGPILRRDFDDGRVVHQWTAECGAVGGWLAVDPRRQSVALGLFSQSSIWQVLALSPQAAVSFTETTEKPPAWLAPGLVDAVRAARTRASGSGGQLELAVDPRDGSRIVSGSEVGLARVRPGPTGPQRLPLYPEGQPRPVNSSVQAVWFDRNPAVEPPWLLQVEKPWASADVRLRAPEGTVQELLTLARWDSHGAARVSQLTTARLPAAAQPAMSLVIDGAWVVLAPKGPARVTPFAVHAAVAPEPGRPPPPQGEGHTPRATGLACSELRALQPEDRFSSPKLFEYGGRAWAAVLVAHTDRSLRFGPVPRPLPKAGAEELTCDWVMDAERSHTALVVAAVTPEGQLVEALRADVHGVGGTLELDRTGDLLTVATSSLSSVTVTQFDLVKVAAALKLP